MAAAGYEKSHAGHEPMTASNRVAAPGRVAKENPAPPTKLNPLRPVIVWASIGVFFLAVSLWSYGGWIFSGDAYPTVPSGPDAIPHTTKVLAWVLQGASVTSAVVALIYLVRRTRRERRLPWDALVAIGFVSVYWMDSLINFYRPVLIFNSYLVNLGSWDQHIPGWISPNGRELPTPILFTGPIYIWAFMGLGMLVCVVARRAHARWPYFGKVRLFMIGMVVAGVCDLLLELVFIRSGLYAYSAVVNELSLFGGAPVQFPLYEAMLVGVLGATIGMLRYNRDDDDVSSIENGLEGTRLSDRGREVVRILAFVGFINAIYLLANGAFIAITFYVDETPAYPSYMTNGICGRQSGVPCAGPSVPVILPTNPRPVIVGSSGVTVGG